MSPRSSKKALLLSLFQSAAGIIFGWGNSEVSGLFNMASYQRAFGECDASGLCTISTTRQSAISGLLSVGAIIGAVGSGTVANRLGLRMTCILFVAIHMVGAAIETSAHEEWAQILIGRLLTGLGIGATSGLVPVFQAEAAPPRFRGLVTGSFQLCVTLGIWGSAMCNWGMSSYDATAKSWRVTTGLQIGFSFLLLLGFIFSPESPRFLAKKGRWEACRKNLANLRGLPMDHHDIDVELDEVRVKTEEDAKLGDPSYAEVFSTKDRILWRLMVGILVQVGQQFTGVNFFFSYGVQFAQTAGLNDTYVFTIILASVNVVMSFPGILAVDRAGRRPVLLFGAALMFVGQIVTGAVSKAHPNSPEAGNVLIAFTCIFIAGFASTWGPVAWVVCGETFPIRLSSICVTLGTGANWLSNLIVQAVSSVKDQADAQFAAPQIQARIGTGITFVWAGCLALAFAFAFFCIPETKGMSIEEVDALYLSHTPAWRSGSFRRTQEEAAIKSHEKHYATSTHREAGAPAPGAEAAAAAKASNPSSANTSARPSVDV